MKAKSILFWGEETIAFCIGYALRPFPSLAKIFFIGCARGSWILSDKLRILSAPFLMELGRTALDRRGPLWVDRAFDGFRMELDLAEKTQRIIFSSKMYEEGITKFVLKTLREGMVFVDVGANVGYYSLLATSRGARVLSCEPERENYARLLHNVALNNFSIQCLPIAIGKENGTMLLHINPLNRGGNSMLSSEVYKTGAHRYSRKEVEVAFGVDALEQTVEVKKLDSLITDRITILKIDVEGFEAQVFEGMKGILAKGMIQNIICELGNKETREAVIHLLKQYDYRAYSIDATGSPVEKETGRDLLFISNKKGL